MAGPLQQVRDAVLGCKESEAGNMFKELIQNPQLSHAAKVLLLGTSDGMEDRGEIDGTKVRENLEAAWRVVEDTEGDLREVDVTFDILLKEGFEAYRRAFDVLKKMTGTAAMQRDILASLGRVAALHSHSGITLVGKRFLVEEPIGFDIGNGAAVAVVRTQAGSLLLERVENLKDQGIKLCSHEMDDGTGNTYLIREDPEGVGTFHFARGGCASIYKGYSEQHGHVAVKIPLESDDLMNPYLETVKREAAALKLYEDADYIIKLLDVVRFTTKNLGGCAEDCLLILPWHGNGTLRTYKCGSFEQAMLYFMQVAVATFEIYGKNNLHRDISVDNVLLADDFRSVVLCDFGLHRCNDQQYMSKVGNPAFAAPEVFTENYDQKVDVWLLGRLLNELVGGLALSSEQEHDLDELLSVMTNTEAGKRHNMEGIVQHDVVIKYSSLLGDPSPCFPPTRPVSPVATAPSSSAPTSGLGKWFTRSVLSLAGYQFVDV